MVPHFQSAEPKKVSNRAISLDLARGAMLLLIALAHAPLYLYNAEPGIMFSVEGVTWFDHFVNFFGFLFIDNRARAMFAVLFGYGLVLIFNSQIKKGKKEEDAVKTIRRRSWYLIVFGMALTIFIGGQDILMAYGIAGLVLSGLVKRENKILIRTFMIITLVYFLIIPILWGAIGGQSLSPGFSANDTYLDVAFSNLFIFPVYPLLIHILFPVLPSILIGMWMARYQFMTRPKEGSKKLLYVAVIGLTISLLGALPVSLIGEVWNPDLFTIGLASALQVLTGIAGGVAYAAIFGIIGAKMTKPGKITFMLTALGKRSLTFYVVNEAFLVLLLSPVAFDLGGLVTNGVAALIAVWIWIVSVATASMLEIKKINGPLEKLLQRLVYKKSY